MSYKSKVIWTEGMFLVPQHFQQWDRYHEGLLQGRLSTLQALGSGACDLEIDGNALIAGAEASDSVLLIVVGLP